MILPAWSIILTAGLPAVIFAAVVSALLYWWPRPRGTFLNRERQRVEILDVHVVSHDTKRFRLSLGDQSVSLGLPVGKHLCIYAPNPSSCLSKGLWNDKPDPDRGAHEVCRNYTPITGDEAFGYVDLLVKIYRPGIVRMPDGSSVTWDDGGKVGSFLDERKPGDFIEIQGPFGTVEYLGKGGFKLPGGTVVVDHVGMLAGGTGITPMLQILTAALRDPSDQCKFSLIYANKTEEDILLRDRLEAEVQASNGRLKVHYTLDFPPPKWKHRVGFISPEMIRNFLPAPSRKPLVLMCGPPAMVEFACKKNLQVLGYPRNCMVAF
mmetsp:Transcript_35455/g.65624  ORF Transcript_35455/g.65624 Transcript_35455/m.65624 type:complete len:321 (-) Transcript_35455:109-1071(-)